MMTGESIIVRTHSDSEDDSPSDDNVEYTFSLNEEGETIKSLRRSKRERALVDYAEDDDCEDSRDDQEDPDFSSASDSDESDEKEELDPDVPQLYTCTECKRLFLSAKGMMAHLKNHLKPYRKRGYSFKCTIWESRIIYRNSDTSSEGDFDSDDTDADKDWSDGMERLQMSSDNEDDDEDEDDDEEPDEEEDLKEVFDADDPAKEVILCFQSVLYYN
ncbi:hypothetical protein ONE63_011577 [Megalurothrips usitatus]|uniref:C2H2-type domain-containing protein n=1 Tax=Megalurothrips usitatus TaxID=439358 RepID=A0AAV7X300_9NEOP|nr:hypothetical protein ONE63_011577 [Megalurothrips usitatus]